MFTLPDILSAYEAWLARHDGKQLKAFSGRRKVDAEAAEAEAAAFGFLWMLNLRPEPFEDPGTGGPDFICRPTGRDEVLVEVTAVHKATLQEKTGLSEDFSKGGAFGFSQGTWAFLRKATDKAGQVAGAEQPRVLMIMTSHAKAHLVMGTKAAEELLTGTTSFSVPLGEVGGNASTVTFLENSVFFRPKKGTTEVEPARQSISAILLGVVGVEGVHVVGLLHPCPAKPLDHGLFDDVHFVRLKSWPLEANMPFSIEWVGMKATPRLFPFIPLFNEDVGGDTATGGSARTGGLST